MASIGIITGTAREAECLNATKSTENFLVKCSGADSDYARRIATEILSQNCSALISFGLAGGLDSKLQSGEIILADKVVTPVGHEWHPDQTQIMSLETRMREDGLFPVTGPVAGVDQAVMVPEDKQVLRQKTGCIAVDMESHVVARAASEAGIPWLVIRVVADPAPMALPAVINGVLALDGTIKPGRLALNLLRRPMDLPALIRLGRASDKGFAALRRVAPLFLSGELF